MGASELASGSVRNAELALSISNYSWTASNSSSSYTGSLGAHNFCAVTGVWSGSPVSGTEIKHFICAVYPSGSNPGNWIIEAHGTVSTTCQARCFLGARPAEEDEDLGRALTRKLELLGRSASAFLHVLQRPRGLHFEGSIVIVLESVILVYDLGTRQGCSGVREP